MIARQTSPSRPGLPSGPSVEIRAEGVQKSFGRREVLRGVSVEVKRGEIVAMVGASGTGKTVLLDIITGLLPTDAGRVLVADHSQPGLPLVELGKLDWEGLDNVRLHWAVVFQRNALFTGTVYDNVALWLREHTGMSEDEIRDRVRESLRAAALDVDDVIGKSRDELSGGMAKRVAIARAIAVEPAVVFYDEPTTGLDPVISAAVHELIYSTHHRPLEDGSRRTTVIVTHDKDLLRRLEPRVVMLHDGGIVFDGTYFQFLESDAEPAVEYLRTMPVLQERRQDG
jgi:phospholipid/cholesterol/gamma-HCH transport system ATP-binding protein